MSAVDLSNDLSTVSISVSEESVTDPIELANTIESYEEQIRELEESGRFREAQQVMNKIKELNLMEAQKREQNLEKQKQRIQKDMKKKHSAEFQEFEEIWNEKTREYDKHATEVIESTIERHNWEREELEKKVRSIFYNQKPKYSKQLLNMKNMLSKLVKQRMYEEAEIFQREMKPLELKELGDFEKAQEAKIQQKLATLNNKQHQELEALKQRIKKVKSELISQKQRDRRRLELQHQNAMKDFEMKQKRVMNKSKDFIGKQSSVLLSSPGKGSLDFSVLSFGQATLDKVFNQLHSSSPVSGINSDTSITSTPTNMNRRTSSNSPNAL